MTTKNLQEDVSVPDHDATTGQGSFVPGPVDNGSAARPADNGSETDADVAVVSGQAVPRSAALQAIVAALQGLDPIALDSIYNQMLALNDSNVDPAAAVAANQGANLASITAKAAVNEIFAGETLSEEFKTKAAVVFEAAVNARVAVETAQIQESFDAKVVDIEAASAARIDEAVESVTGLLVESLDVATNNIADRFVEVNQPIVESTIETIAAKRFMTEVVALAESYNIRIPTQDLDAVAALTEEVETLRSQLNEEVAANLETTKRNLVLERNATLERATQGLSALQADRVQTLVENANLGEDPESFDQGVTAIVESVVASAAAKPAVLLNEGLDNGIILEGADAVAPKPAHTPHMGGLLAALQRTSNA